MEVFLDKNIGTVLLRILLVLGVSAAGCIPSAFAQDQDSCRDVAFAKKIPSEYSAQNLKKRLAQDPSDVDALIHTGLRLEEQGKDTEAYSQYQKAIQARPNCSLGYLFAALVEEKISGETDSDAEAKMRKAVGLQPTLQSDPNVVGFLQRHRKLAPSTAAGNERSESAMDNLLGTANHFWIGVGVGVVLVTPFLYFVRRKQTAVVQTPLGTATPSKTT